MWYPKPLMVAVMAEVEARPAMLSRLGWSGLMWSCSRFRLHPGSLFDILAEQVGCLRWTLVQRLCLDPSH